MEGVLTATASRDSVSFEQFRQVRAERMNQGQRFRYGGEHLVAIDASDDLIWSYDMERKPEPVSFPAGQCAGCTARDSTVAVQLVVTVGPDGHVRWVESRGGPKDKILNAAVEAVKRWEFRPAAARGKPVADWAVVSVPVRSTQAPH
jgi:TonB family protein